MHRVTRILGAGTALALLVIGTAACSDDRVAVDSDATTHEATTADTDKIDRDAFRRDMRKLWEDHVTWTRLFIVSAVAGLPDSEATAGRLLQNQADIGEALAGFFGDEVGNGVTERLREHILVAADLVAAAKAGDTDALTRHRDLWYANADEVARYLAEANPSWPEETLRSMMRAHLDQTLEEATARLKGDWTKDIAAYDHIHAHILEMSDALAEGIIRQLPDRFGA